MTIAEAATGTDRRHIEAATSSDNRSARSASAQSTRPRAREVLMATPTEHLEAEAMSLVRRMQFGTYELLTLVGELDDRGAWAAWGALSCAAWSDNRMPRRTVSEVVVHVRPDGNTLADGTPLSDHVVGRLLPDAFVSLLMEDNRRHPIDASPRRRFPTRRQRRVVDVRDPECAHGGCHARDFLQYDHRGPYDPDHPNTVIGNLQRRCGPHNRAKGNRPHDHP